jgi:SAM-dependent methyltransferase
MLNNIDVVEIGGGYGGLCFFIYKLAHLFDISINTYSIFDLQAPLMVQKKYLENLNIINLNYVELDDFKNIKENSFLISNYAFSEISLDLQKRYTTSVLNPYISHGFLAWNNIDVYNFIDNKNIAIENEIPLTGPKNKYVSFKPNTD